MSETPGDDRPASETGDVLVQRHELIVVLDDDVDFDPDELGD